MTIRGLHSGKISSDQPSDEIAPVKEFQKSANDMMDSFEALCRKTGVVARGETIKA